MAAETPQQAYRKRNREKLNRKARERYRNDPDGAAKARKSQQQSLNRLDIYLRCVYGLSGRGFYDLLRRQLWVCAICRLPSTERLHVDHNHNTRTVRGLLCGTCNRGIGQLKDDPQLCLRAAAYLDMNGESNA